MTTIEKIKAEIEKQRKFIEGMFIEGDNNFYDGQDDAYNNVLTFLSTLEDEKPVPNDLEEAADNHIREVVDAAGHPGWDWETRDIKDAFIAGSKWEKEQDMDEWLKDRDGCFWDGVNEGKKAMKEQMMKEAVEGEVIKTDKHTSVRYKSYYGTDRYFYGIANKQLKPGNKVRIIVLKKEDEK